MLPRAANWLTGGPPVGVVPTSVALVDGCRSARRRPVGALGHRCPLLHAIALAGALAIVGHPYRKPLQGAIGLGHLQGGDRLQPRPPPRKGTAPARGQIAGAVARGWPALAWRPQGAAVARGHAAGAAANGLQTAARRKAACGQRHRPWRCRP
ncbi:hypothetical protein GW17_00027374 [Ensete ventricosum]|nr:hypothetical protein GW17_00027374 [Ensete ventricosum]